MSTLLNKTLLQFAQIKVANEQRMRKSAVVPAPPPMDPAAMGGAPPMDPAMMGGAPPMDPAAMGGAPPMDPAMMGGAPPMDPSMMGGAPPMDPSMMGGAPPAPAPPMDPAAAAAGASTTAPVKLKPEDRINQVDYRLYNMQQQLTAIMNAMDVQLPPGAMVTPPGSPVPVAEAAVPGGSQDPGPPAGPQGGAENGTGINPIEALGAFNPAGGGGGGGGGEPKQARQRQRQQDVDITDLLSNIVGCGVDMSILKSAADMPQQTYSPAPARRSTNMHTNMAAAAAVLRSRLQHK